MTLTKFLPYFAIILAATSAAALRSYQLYQNNKNHHQHNKNKYEQTAMCLLALYLATNLSTEIYATQLALHYTYNHHIHALNMLLSQALLCASLSYFSQLQPLTTTYSLLILPLYLYTYLTNQYWQPGTVMPQHLYAAHNALMAIASIIFCGTQLYRYLQQSQQQPQYPHPHDQYPHEHQHYQHQQHSHLPLGLICLLYHLYLQLADSFQLSETLASLLNTSDTMIYMLIPATFYLALFLYLIRYPKKPKPQNNTSPEP